MTEGAVYETLHRRPMLASYRKAILLSALIMFIGIGSLIVARHPALHSLAQVTIVGMSSVVLMALVLPPTLFRWYVRYRRHFWVKSKGLRVKN
jgi:predicted RND superfamily exporter protein